MHHDGSIPPDGSSDAGLDGSPSDGDGGGSNGSGDGDGGGGSNGGGGNATPDAGPAELPAGTVIHDPTCGDFTVPQNTFATFDAPSGERRIVLHCTTGTLPSGPMGSICRGGVWSLPAGACYYPTYTDPRTGYEWQAFHTPSVMSFWDASMYCYDLELGGHSDWFLPFTPMLLSLLDLEGGTLAWPEGAIPAEQADDPVFAVDFYRSVRAGYGVWGTYARELGYVRCVRNAPFPQATMRDNHDGTVTDLATGLVWQKGFDAKPPTTIAGATEYCASLGLPGSGWRLPTLRELVSIIDFYTGASQPYENDILDNEYFPRGQQAAISSTPIPGMPGHTYYVSWYGFTAFRGIFGNLAANGKADPDEGFTIGVRCVR
ncbi:MAG: DUF1566 domain-containing protein [Polyangiales bacterium]